MAEEPSRWRSGAQPGVYAELDHPADVFLEIWGRDLPALFENALFALYDQMAELEGFETGLKKTITARAAGPAEALRALLSEALYRFETKGFVATRADLSVRTLAGGDVEAIAELHGENIDKSRHTLLTEVKAVTYHQLSVEVVPDEGWRATVLLDV